MPSFPVKSHHECSRIVTPDLHSFVPLMFSPSSSSLHHSQFWVSCASSQSGSAGERIQLDEFKKKVEEISSNPEDSDYEHVPAMKEVIQKWEMDMLKKESLDPRPEIAMPARDALKAHSLTQEIEGGAAETAKGGAEALPTASAGSDGSSWGGSGVGGSSRRGGEGIVLGLDADADADVAPSFKDVESGTWRDELGVEDRILGADQRLAAEAEEGDVTATDFERYLSDEDEVEYSDVEESGKTLADEPAYGALVNNYAARPMNPIVPRTPSEGKIDEKLADEEVETAQVGETGELGDRFEEILRTQGLPRFVDSSIKV